MLAQIHCSSRWWKNDGIVSRRQAQKEDDELGGSHHQHKAAVTHLQ